MRKILEKLLLLIFVVVFQSCNINEDLFAPKINLDSENGIYTVKYGRELIIAPTYEHAEDATYSWTIDGVIISFAPSLSFKMDAVGEYYVTLTVRNDIGKDEEENKLTCVRLYGLEGAKIRADMCASDCHAVLEGVEGDTSFLHDLVDFVRTRSK